jgi:hypothetical protein
MTYYASYGPRHFMAASLRDIRIAARKLALDVKYDIKDDANRRLAYL